MTTRRQFLALAAAAAATPVHRARAAHADPVIDAMRFSALRAGAPLPEWLQPQVFENRPKHTEYALVEDEGRTVLRARAVASTSGLVRALRIDPGTHPILAWRWKVMNLIEQGDLATKAGDDFPARLYVTFELDADKLPAGERIRIGLARRLYGQNVPLAVLCYVWDGKAAAGTFAPSAYTERVRLIVVDSGAARLGRWVSHERNVAADFKRAFGMAAPAIGGVIVSTDTDDTGASALTYFGDIEFRPRPTS